MSRITRGRAGVGDLASAADLNGTYSDFTQTGALNTYNTRDQAFDLPHFTNTPIVLNKATALLGNSGMLHAAPYTTVASTTNASSPIKSAVADSTGTTTFLNLSSAPWTMASGDVLRLWWNLSVFSAYSTSPTPPWDDASALGLYNILTISPGATNITDSLHLWVVWVQWDITSASLLNWVEVPGQSGFTSTLGSHKGNYLSDMAASSVISPWTVFSPGSADGGKVVAPHQDREQGWFGNYGMWAYPATGSKTIYGIRLAITGILHPAHLATGSEENVIVYDENVTGSLYYKGGRLSALHMRGS